MALEDETPPQASTTTFEGNTPVDLMALVLAARAKDAMEQMDDPTGAKAAAEVAAARRGVYVADLKVGDVVHRGGTEFGRVTKIAHEADDLNTGQQVPTIQIYVTIQWGRASFARYTDDTLDWYAIKKIVMPTQP